MNSLHGRDELGQQGSCALETPVNVRSADCSSLPVPLSSPETLRKTSTEHLKFLSFLELMKSIVPEPSKTFARERLVALQGVRARAQMGRGVQPLSYRWGFDRGLPIHRYYVEQFLQEFAADIYGHCLEFQDGGYTTRFGGAAVKTLDILHLDSSNPRATLVGDLTKPNQLPKDEFDCIICTHVLHVIPELDKAVAELYRMLKFGGVLLVAVPHVSMCDPYEYHDLWRFTPDGLALVLGKVFGAADITLRVYGNSLTAAGEIRGLVSHEFSKTMLDYTDPRFAVEVCARACKAG